MLAVTGTDGKTTTTLLTAAMLRAAGLRTVAAGNTDVPLVEAIDRDLDVLRRRVHAASGWRSPAPSGPMPRRG